MKTIKYITCLSAICFFSVNVRGQYAIAGTYGGIYLDIIPDTLLNPYPPSGVHEYYYFDINQDGNNDIKIDAYGAASPGYTSLNVTISSLDSLTSFSLGSIDSTYIVSSSCGNNFWIIRSILKVYSSGDTIKNADYVSSGYLGYVNQMGQPSCYYVTSSEWVNKGDVFFGVRYQTASDTLYGWVKVNLPDYYKCLVKEFSLGSPLTGIYSNVDINNFVSIYPSPANNRLQVTAGSNKLIFISIYDLLGKEMISTKEKEIDLSDFQNGIYFINIKTEEGMVSKKIIINK